MLIIAVINKPTVPAIFLIKYLSPVPVPLASVGINSIILSFILILCEIK